MPGGNMVDDDLSYYRNRVEMELLRANEASRANVAVIHLELAKQYQALVDQTELREAIKASSPVRLWV